MDSRTKTWHRVTRTLLTLDEDQARTRANTASALMAGTTLLLTRTGSQPPEEWLYGETEQVEKAGSLIGFQTTRLEDDAYPPLPPAVGHARHATVPWRARLNSVNGLEKIRERGNELRRSVETLMPPDSYVSVTMRRRGLLEQSRIRDWVADEGNTVEDENDLVKANALCARITTGCADPNQAKGFAANVGQAVSSLSDMGEKTSLPCAGLPATLTLGGMLCVLLTVGAPWGWKPMLIPLAFSLIHLLVTGVMRLMGVHPSDWWILPPLLLAGAVMLGVAWTPPIWLPLPLLPFLLFAVFRWSRRSLWDDIMERPRTRITPPSHRKAAGSDKETRLGMLDMRRQVEDYPLQRSTLILPPGIVTSLALPVDDSVAARQETHPVPDVLSHDGVPLGTDQTGRTGHVPADQLYKGVAITGEQGSGKSVLTYGFMQWALAHRDDTPGSIWGQDSSVIDFAMKDDHAITAMNRWHAKHGTPPSRTVTYLADERYATLDMCGLLDGLDAARTATGIAAAMQYSFDDGDIRNDSLDVIANAMTIAITATRYQLAHGKLTSHAPDRPLPLGERIRRLSQDTECFGCEQAHEQKSPIGWALMALCGSDGQVGSARALGKVMRALAVEQPCDDTVQAARAAEQLYGRPDSKGRNTVNDRTLLERTNASRNKVRQFMACEHVFTPRRGKLTWRGLLGTPGEYHVVLAPHDGRSLPERMDRILGAWLMYRMWNTMTGMCQGWQAQGRHVMLVCDELSMLANSDDRILCQLHEQGRSFGLILVFATQYVQQFSPGLMRSFTGYGTYVTFNTSDPEVAQTAADRLTDSDGADGWTRGAVVNLPAHWAAVRTRTVEQTQPSFLVHVHDFESDPA